MININNYIEKSSMMVIQASHFWLYAAHGMDFLRGVMTTLGNAPIKKF